MKHDGDQHQKQLHQTPSRVDRLEATQDCLRIQHTHSRHLDSRNNGCDEMRDVWDASRLDDVVSRLSTKIRNTEVSDTLSTQEISTTNPTSDLQNINETCYMIRYSSGERNITEPPKHEKHPVWKVWGCGFLAVSIISLSGVMGVIFIPIMENKSFKIIMRGLVGLGVGTLSATAVFQLIPEQKSSAKKNHNAVPRPRKTAASHVHAIPSELEAIEQDGFLPRTYEARWQRQNSDGSTDGITVNPLHGSHHNVQFKKPVHHRSHDLLADENTSISSVAWMIIFGDGLHNFIDGVSIGAGFTDSITTGVSISLAIMCEEFPHELGDFAILINSGMSVKKALTFNFASACTAFVGLFLGLSLEKLEINTYIFGFAGGLFLYISLADLIPQLNEMVDEALQSKSTKSATYILLQQNVGVLFGMVILFLITKYGDDIKID
ncbi:hypothetical protein B566_EDAN005065 [Ephemera danica]|nr:hypothetical protein B566_EDAN005065 [Ephemera danica]